MTYAGITQINDHGRIFFSKLSLRTKIRRNSQAKGLVICL